MSELTRAKRVETKRVSERDPMKNFDNFSFPSLSSLNDHDHSKT